MATRTTIPPLTPARRRPAPAPRRRGRGRWLVGFLAVIVLAVLAVAGAVLLWSGATLKPDPSALARVQVQALGGKLVSTRAVGSDGRPIPLSEHAGRLTPRRKVTPGERISIDVVVRRPGWNAWALGDTRRERLTVRAPVAHPRSRWLTVGAGTPVTVRFDHDVSAVTYDGRRAGGLRSPRRSISLGRRSPAGSVQVAAAARTWEKLGRPTTVSWFPKTGSPVAVASPAPAGKLSPAAPIRLTFSQTVAQALGSSRPKLSPAVPGSWKPADSHTLVFTPTGFGVGFDTKVKVELPRSVSVTGPDGRAMHATREISWTVPPGSSLRLHQLLAQAGYLPVRWKPAGADVPHTAAAETRAAVTPPKGTFSWRWANTPPELKAQWNETKGSEITRGAIMKFQDRHGLDVDAVAGPAMWKALMTDAMKGRKLAGGYSYVYVHRDGSPQTMTLWHNGKTVFTSPGNTGVAAAPTDLGTFPVFEHIPVTTMSGTNPDGSHYSDPGIKWVSYFNGGDALHAFNRATFGTPQSVGCVELPEAAAARLYPYTPIGTLVTIES
jgi:peptidoglycan hydrolase-like protein with peptidoglycan-binding domain